MSHKIEGRRENLRKIKENIKNIQTNIELTNDIIESTTDSRIRAQLEEKNMIKLESLESLKNEFKGEMMLRQNQQD